MIRIIDTKTNEELEFSTLQKCSDYLSEIIGKPVAKSTIFNAGKKNGTFYKKRFKVELVTYQERKNTYGCSSDKRTKHNKWTITQFKEFPDIIHLRRTYQLYDEDLFAEIKDMLKKEYGKKRFDFWFDRTDDTPTNKRMVKYLKKRRMKCSINILLRYIDNFSFVNKTNLSIPVMNTIDNFVQNWTDDECGL